jgi:hypothetical protein
MENNVLNDVAEEEDEEDEDDLVPEEEEDELDDEEDDDASEEGNAGARVPNGVLEGGVAEPHVADKPKRTALQADIVR